MSSILTRAFRLRRPAAFYRRLLQASFASFLAVGSAAQATAQTAAEPIPQITITGQASVSATPDMAVVTARVVTAGKTAPEALSGNSAAMTAVIDKIKAFGIAGKDIQTSGFSINPRYTPSQNWTDGAPRIIGYDVSNGVTVKIRDLDTLGAILDTVVASGANQIGGIQFQVSDPEDKLNEARKQAVANARERAMLYAEAAGAELGPILLISETGFGAPRPVAMRMERAMAADAVPIEAGEMALRASVTITWELEED